MSNNTSRYGLRSTDDPTLPADIDTEFAFSDYMGGYNGSIFGEELSISEPEPRKAAMGRTDAVMNQFPGSYSAQLRPDVRLRFVLLW